MARQERPMAPSLTEDLRHEASIKVGRFPLDGERDDSGVEVYPEEQAVIDRLLAIGSLVVDINSKPPPLYGERAEPQSESAPDGVTSSDNNSD